LGLTGGGNHQEGKTQNVKERKECPGSFRISATLANGRSKMRSVGRIGGGKDEKF